MNMRKWYDGINLGQKLFLFGLSTIPVFLGLLEKNGFVMMPGFVALCVLTFCQLGSSEPLVPETKKSAPDIGDPDYLEWANKEGRWAEKNPD